MLREAASSSFQALARLIAEFKPYKGRVLAVLLLGIVISAIQPASVKVSQQVIDSLQKGSHPFLFRWIAALLIPLFILNGLAKYLHNTLRRSTTENVILRLRSALFGKYLTLPVSALDAKRSGELLSNIQNDLFQISTGVDTLTSLLKEPFTFLGLIAVAFYFDWQLALCTLVAAPIIIQLFSRTGWAVKRYSKRNLEEFASLLSMTQEIVSGSRIVKVFGLETVLSKKFNDLNQHYLKTKLKSIRVEEIPTPLVELIGAALMVGVISYGGYRISQGWLTAGELVAFVITVGLCQMPIKELNNAWLKLKAAEAAAERVYQILDTPIPTRWRHGMCRVDGFNQSIRFENVGLAYGDKRALKGIHFEVKRGECVAFVGESGSGKSSIVNLLPRLFDVSEGRIVLDGTDIRDIFLDDLRRLISFVTQDTFLFNDTIFENIRYGNSMADRKQVEHAARLAHCTDFIGRQPYGFETVIGDRGVCLSGGERQRLAIARAILKASPILVLDEATSNLDSQSEELVQGALETLMVDKTTFLVAHRFTTVKRASRIYVVDGGSIVEDGSHEELVRNQGLYKDLFQRQIHIIS
ncbi:MAG: ABC transporter ATP-binding protein [Deltaproteobacteria bacterium]|nr:ABC transporter ATP-binding protein [Deltaproteobacteria bacterium]